MIKNNIFKYDETQASANKNSNGRSVWKHNKIKINKH